MNTENIRDFEPRELEPPNTIPSCREILKRLLVATTVPTDTQYKILTAQQEGALIDIMSAAQWAEDEMLDARKLRDDALAKLRTALVQINQMEQLVECLEKSRDDALSLAGRAISALSRVNTLANGSPDA